jgi:hypothetical protein
MAALRAAFDSKQANKFLLPRACTSTVLWVCYLEHQKPEESDRKNALSA